MSFDKTEFSNEGLVCHTGLSGENGSLPKKRLLNDKEAANFLGGISLPTFYKLKNAGHFNPVLIGAGVVRYDLEDLELFIVKNKQSNKS